MTEQDSDTPLALVIGCGDMGMGCARRLGRDRPLLLVDIDGARLEREVEALRGEGYRVRGHCCDITDPAQTRALGAALRDGPGVYALAHVAAVGPSIGDWRKLMAVNLIGPHLVLDAVMPHMVRGGVIILVSSSGGHIAGDAARDAALAEPLAPRFLETLVAALGGEPDLIGAYMYSKRALILLARKLAVELGPRGVRAVSFSPGAIDTTMGRRDGALVPDRASMIAATPLGRQGTVEECAEAVAFLASAGFMNGVDLLMDGGLSATRTPKPR